MRLPDALQSTDDTVALGYLNRYYHCTVGARKRFTGAEFDGWDSAGARAADADRFTADDLIAITFLSVQVRAVQAIQILQDADGVLSGLLADLGPDRDLAEEGEPLSSDFAGWKLMAELRKLDHVGATTASKLVARKRPRLRPVYDSVVAAVTDSTKGLWEPLRIELRKDNKALHRRLLALKAQADLPTEVSALRVFDVIAWMEGQTPTWAMKTIQLAPDGAPVADD
jgi:hypothetical protein